MNSFNAKNNKISNKHIVEKQFEHPK